jgi:Flp pilus assembly protein TadG
LEAAACVPVAFVLLFGTVEVTRAIHLRQTLSIAAYEGARTAVTPDTSVEAIRQAIEGVLQDRDVTDHTITISPLPLDSIPKLGWITIAVSTPASTNAVLPLSYFTGNKSTITVTTKVMKEF